MNLLLDTHVLLWVLTDERSISKAARSAIEHPGNQVFVSAATAWEIAIKRGLGKLRAPQDYLESLELYRFTPLDISSEHALAVEHLPKHHNDPFDRLLIAQALTESLTLVTRDDQFGAYEVGIIKA
ncbi:MAG: type II toxin-antitoxin system VapC family toxin [Trueperaceae bacterium]|jgi:PIN domain nuclease of toxin-antitoxin system